MRSGMGINMTFRPLITRSLFLQKLLSPVVVDAIVEKREGEKLCGDVEHLQVEVEVNRLKVFVARICVLGTEPIDFLEVVIEEVPFIVVIKHESKNLHHNNHDYSAKLDDSESNGNIREIHPGISIGQKRPDPHHASKRPGD
jgi:hypothetical protein